ncbi:MAG: helix-turn-helix domain-containing protein [Prevotella sp.]
MERLLHISDEGQLTLNIVSTEDMERNARQAAEEAAAMAVEKLRPSINNELLTCEEVQKMCFVCRSTLTNWAHSGYLVPVKIGHKVRYRLSDVQAILNGERKP